MSNILAVYAIAAIVLLAIGLIGKYYGKKYSGRKFASEYGGVGIPLHSDDIGPELKQYFGEIAWDDKHSKRSVGIP